MSTYATENVRGLPGGQRVWSKYMKMPSWSPTTAKGLHVSILACWAGSAIASIPHTRTYRQGKFKSKTIIFLAAACDVFISCKCKNVFPRRQRWHYQGKSDLESTSDVLKVVFIASWEDVLLDRWPQWFLIIIRFVAINSANANANVPKQLKNTMERVLKLSMCTPYMFKYCVCFRLWEGERESHATVKTTNFSGSLNWIQMWRNQLILVRTVLYVFYPPAGR